MAKSKSADLDIPRLCLAMRRSRWMLERPRSNVREMVRQYVGPNYSEDGTREKTLLNLIALFVSVVGRKLIAKEPRILLSTFDRAAKPTVAAMQTFANREIQRMNLANTLQRGVVDALFSVGIAKVALASPSDAAEAAWNLRAGEPCVWPVHLDDFVFDSHARDFEEVGFIGHRYRVPLDTVKDSKLYSQDRKDLTESADQPYNQEGDERIGMIGRGYREMMTQEYEPHVDLWEVYLPRHRLVVTLADDWIGGGPTTGNLEPLRVQRWIGPDHGPYHILGYRPVPGNAMPKAPIQDLLDLHEACNRSLRKVMRAIDRMKEVTAVQGGAMEDGSRVMQADDGDILRVDNPAAIVQMVLGGQTIQQAMAGAMQFKDYCSYMGGNFEVLGGTGPQAKTAHQEELLNENAGGGISDLVDRTIGWVTQVITSLCWYYHHHPIRVQHAIHSLGSMPHLQVMRKVTPQMRQQVPFEALDIKVDPYSMAHQTPQAIVAGLNQVVQQVIAPMMPLLQQQGIAFDLNAYLQKVSRYMDLPDLQEILTIREPPQQKPMGGDGGGPKMPVATERTYNRVSMPGRTQKGNDQNMVSSLMGVNPGGNPQGNGRLQPLKPA